MTFDFIDSPGDDVAEIEADAETLKRTLNGIVNVDETKIHFAPDCIGTTYVDPANVMMGSLTIPREALDTYVNYEDAVVATSTTMLDDALRPARVTASDSVALSAREMQMEATVERDYADGSTTTYRNVWKCIDPESVRQEPDIPNLDLQTVDVDVGQLHDAINVLDTPYSEIHVTSTDDGLVLSGHDDTSGGEVTIHGDYPKAINSIFSVDYLADIADAVKTLQPNDVTLGLGEEIPMKLEWERDDGINGVYMLAPRVQRD